MTKANQANEIIKKWSLFEMAFQDFENNLDKNADEVWIYREWSIKDYGDAFREFFDNENIRQLYELTGIHYKKDFKLKENLAIHSSFRGLREDAPSKETALEEMIGIIYNIEENYKFISIINDSSKSTRNLPIDYKESRIIENSLWIREIYVRVFRISKTLKFLSTNKQSAQPFNIEITANGVIEKAKELQKFLNDYKKTNNNEQKLINKFKVDLNSFIKHLSNGNYEYKEVFKIVKIFRMIMEKIPKICFSILIGAASNAVYGLIE